MGHVYSDKNYFQEILLQHYYQLKNQLNISFIKLNIVKFLLYLPWAAIYKMFGLCHFQALENNWSIGQHNFFIFFIFSIFYTRPRGHNKRMLTKGYSVPQDFSWIENYKLICQKKGWPKFLLTLNFHCSKFLSPLENFVT